MRPLKLVLSGFGAYAQDQEISFDDVELFAITGSTGAGKSTLLDAITFALYKTTARMGSTGMKELIHPEVVERNGSAKVALTFQIGDAVWRIVRVIGKENQSRLEHLVEDSFVVHKASEKVKELDAKIVELLGMDYETFTRAVLLPQGQFDLFLRGKPSERREMLMKLYGLEAVRSMRERVSEKVKTLRESVMRLQGELDGLGGVDEELLSRMREEIAALKEQDRIATAEVSSREKELKLLEEIQLKFQEKASLERRLETWQSRSNEIAKGRDRLESAQRAETIWPQVQAKNISEKELTSSKNDEMAASEILEKIKHQLNLLGTLDTSERLEELHRLEGSIPLLRVQLERLSRFGGTLASKHLAPLAFSEDRLDVLRDVERISLEASKQLTALAKAKQELADSQKELLEAQLFSKEIATEIEVLKAQGTTTGEELKALEASLTDAKNKHGVAAHRHLLKVDEQCPLCGQVVGSLPLEADAHDFAGLEKNVGELRTKVEGLRVDYRTELNRSKEILERIPKLESQAVASQREFDQQEKLSSALQKDLRSLPNSTAAKDEKAAMLAGLAVDILRQTSGRSVEDFSKSIEVEIRDLDAKSQKRKQLEGELNQATLTHSGKVEIRLERERSLERQALALAASMKESEFDDQLDVEKARLSTQERSALTASQQQHESEGNIVTANLKSLERELDSRKFVSFDEVLVKKQELELKRQLARSAHGDAVSKESVLNIEEKKLGRKRDLLAEKSKSDAQLHIWEQLQTDLKGDRFQDFLLRHYQSDLMKRASELILQLSHQRYVLRLEDDEYKVLDRWTESVRPVKTLSGGESFMASLSLALALSEHLSRGRIGALFLDEGFGTLDAETLEEVAGVLESLPTGGRLVGIVTHVEGLAERMPARLLVEKHQTGSIVKWAE